MRGSFLLLLAALQACSFQRYVERPLDPELTAIGFAGRTLDAPELVAFARANLGQEQAFPPAQWELETLALAAVFYRPEIGLARTQVEEARAAAVSAGARPNPTLSFDPEAVPGTDQPWILGWRLDFPLETAGKRGLRRQAAAERVHAAEPLVALTAWRVRGDVFRALVELRAARAAEQQLQRERAAWSEHAAVLERMLAAGQVSSLELRTDRRELARLGSALEEARTRGEGALAALARAVGVERGALASAELVDGWPLPLTPAPSSGDARALGLESRLDLRAALADYAATEAELRLEVARQYPDVSFTPGASWDQGDRKFALGFALELPLFAKNEGPLAEAEARRSASVARFTVLQQEIIGAIEGARLAYEGALRARDAAAHELELARTEEARVARALQAGATDRLAELDARIVRLGLERSLAEREAECARAQGALELELQRPLDVARDPLPPAGTTP